MAADIPVPRECDQFFHVVQPESRQDRIEVDVDAGLEQEVDRIDRLPPGSLASLPVMVGGIAVIEADRHGMERPCDFIDIIFCDKMPVADYIRAQAACPGMGSDL